MTQQAPPPDPFDQLVAAAIKVLGELKTSQRRHEVTAKTRGRQVKMVEKALRVLQPVVAAAPADEKRGRKRGPYGKREKPQLLTRAEEEAREQSGLGPDEQDGHREGEPVGVEGS